MLEKKKIKIYLIIIPPSSSFSSTKFPRFKNVLKIQLGSKMSEENKEKSLTGRGKIFALSPAQLTHAITFVLWPLNQLPL